MIALLNTILDKGEDLLMMHDHESYEGSQEDIYLEIHTKATLFFSKLKDDSLNLKSQFEKIPDTFTPASLYLILRLLKKAWCYFEIPVDDTEPFWNYMHPLIRGITKHKFDQGFYADAIETALKEINSIVKTAYKVLSGEELDGAALMHRVFAPGNPVYTFDTIETETGRNIQQGYMHIFAGAMIGIRNPKAHENMHPDKLKTIHLLFISSFMAIKLEELGLIDQSN